jgi:hypothetical protein
MELLKPSASVALHQHSNALVDTLSPKAKSSFSLLSQSEKLDITYNDIRGCDIQKQGIQEVVELPSSPSRCSDVWIGLPSNATRRFSIFGHLCYCILSSQGVKKTIEGTNTRGMLDETKEIEQCIFACLIQSPGQNK